MDNKLHIKPFLKFTYNFVHTWFIRKERILNILKGYNLNIYYKFIQSLSSEGGWYGLKKIKRTRPSSPLKVKSSQQNYPRWLTLLDLHSLNANAGKICTCPFYELQHLQFPWIRIDLHVHTGSINISFKFIFILFFLLSLEFFLTSNCHGLCEITPIK